jgi:hypothetical protein
MRAITPFILSSLCAFSAPAWESEITLREAGSRPLIESCSLDFTLSWKGMLKAGTMHIDFAPPDAKKPGSFVTKSSASSQGAAAILFPYKLNYWSEIDPKTLRPKYFHSTEIDDVESIVTTNRYSSGKTKVNEVSTKVKTGAVATEAYTFPIGPAYDMFSAILSLRSKKLDPGDEHTLLLVPLKTPYLLKVRVEAKEKHMERDAIRLSFSLRKIDRKSHELVPYKKLKKPVTLWMSDDKDRIPLELRASVYIGDVRAVLTDFKKNP